MPVQRHTLTLLHHQRMECTMQGPVHQLQYPCSASRAAQPHTAQAQGLHHTAPVQGQHRTAPAQQHTAPAQQHTALGPFQQPQSCLAALWCHHLLLLHHCHTHRLTHHQRLTAQAQMHTALPLGPQSVLLMADSVQVIYQSETLKLLWFALEHCPASAQVGTVEM